MRLLFTSVGGYGHFHPIAPLALAATRRGHDVIVATGAWFGDWVRKCGLIPAEAGGGDDWHRQIEAATRADIPLRQFHMFSTFAVPSMLRDLCRLAETWSPDLVVHEEGEFAAPLFAAMRGIPCVTHSWPAPARPESELSVFRTLLEPIWVANGVATPARTSGDRYFDACPPAFQSDAIRSISSVVPIRPLMFDGPLAPEPPWLADLPRPAAYVTFGTVGIMSTPEILQLVTDALEPLLSAVVVTTGPNAPDVLGKRPSHTRVVQYLPQSQVLPHVDMVVSHGGAGTTLGCVLSALPHLVIPGQAFSQNRNAAQTVALGMGATISRPGASVEAVRGVADTILTDPAYQQAAVRTRAGLDELPSPDAAVGILESLPGRTIP